SADRVGTRVEERIPVARGQAAVQPGLPAASTAAAGEAPESARPASRTAATSRTAPAARPAKSAAAETASESAEPVCFTFLSPHSASPDAEPHAASHLDHALAELRVPPVPRIRAGCARAGDDEQAGVILAHRRAGFRRPVQRLHSVERAAVDPHLLELRAGAVGIALRAPRP